MGQLRDDYPEFQKRNTEVIAIGAASPKSFRSFWEKEAIPYPGLPDPAKSVLKRFGQQFKLLKFGRMPAVIVVDMDGAIRYAHHGSSASDIPENHEILAVLDELNQ